MGDWSFLTNHGRAILFIAAQPDARLRDIADALGVTERAAYKIVVDLADAGYVVKEREGRRNRYQIQDHLPLRDPIGRERTIGELLDLLADTTRQRTPVTPHGPDIRPIVPSDGAALVRFHELLSPESQRSRFFTAHPHLSATEVERFTNVDHRDREALVAVIGADIVGVGRYDRLGASPRAEVAFVTRDDHQGTGIATTLLQQLTVAAHRVGITCLVAETLAGNTTCFTSSPRPASSPTVLRRGRRRHHHDTCARRDGSNVDTRRERPRARL